MLVVVPIHLLRNKALAPKKQKNLVCVASSSTLCPLGRECPTTRHNTTTTPRGMMGRRTWPWQQVGLVRPSPWTEPCDPPPPPSPRQPPGSTHWAATSHITTIRLAWLARPIRTLLGLSLSKKRGNTCDQRHTIYIYVLYIYICMYTDACYVYTHILIACIFDL